MHLFTPYRLGRVEVRNRIASAPHNTWFGESGMVGERYIRYDEEKARGGVGVVVAFGSMAVHPSSAVARTNSRLSVTFHNEYDEREYDLNADPVVLAGGRAPVDGLHDDLRAHRLPVHVIGDAPAPRSLHDAVLEGTRAARAI
jgi:hypothetical protein